MKYEYMVIAMTITAIAPTDSITYYQVIYICLKVVENKCMIINISKRIAISNRQKTNEKLQL